MSESDVEIVGLNIDIICCRPDKPVIPMILPV